MSDEVSSGKSSAITRALVLGGGGVTAIAWETGFLTGLAAQGLDVGETADLVVGTSAGATVAAQITSGIDIKALMAAQLDPGSGAEPKIATDVKSLMREIELMKQSARSPLEGRQLVGTLALKADVPSGDVRLTIIKRRLPSHEWPERNLAITAVDAVSGDFVLLDRTTGLGLVDAVAASCAIPGVWPPVAWEQRRLIDGGVRSGANEDVASGYGRVLILQPMGVRGYAKDVAVLPPGSTFRVEPDEHYEAVAADPMDPSSRPQAARAGHAHATLIVEEVREFWATTDI